MKIAGCERCREAINSPTNELSGDEASLTQRVKELELELARTKLSQVEAECRNQVWYNIAIFAFYGGYRSRIEKVMASNIKSKLIKNYWN